MLTPLEEREGWGIKSANNLFAAIRERKKVTFDRFLYALGINHVGETTAKIISRNYISFKHFMEAAIASINPETESYQHLVNISGIGPKAADAIIAFFNEEHNKKVLDELQSEVEISDYEPTSSDRSIFSGKTIVFTGTMEKMSRNEAKARAESIGANVTNSVSKKTDYVIAGKKAGNKIRKAAKLGVKIISEEDWLEILEEKSG